MYPLWIPPSLSLPHQERSHRAASFPFPGEAGESTCMWFSCGHGLVPPLSCLRPVQDFFDGQVGWFSSKYSQNKTFYVSVTQMSQRARLLLSVVFIDASWCSTDLIFPVFLYSWFCFWCKQSILFLEIYIWIHMSYNWFSLCHHFTPQHELLLFQVSR